MKKLFVFFVMAGLGMIALSAPAAAQMMPMTHHQSAMHNQNENQQAENEYMSDMMAMQDSITEKCSLIVSDFDSLETDFDRIMKITDSEKRQNEMNKYKYQMLSLQDRISKLEQMENQMQEKIRARDMMHAMHKMLNKLFGYSGQMKHSNIES